MFCWKGQGGCSTGTFSTAKYPIYGETNVGFSLTFANMLQQSLPADEGVVLVNTGVGGTGFYAHEWNPPNGPLVVQSIAVVKALAAALPTQLGGNYSFHSALWHQGEQDAGDNSGAAYQADYCTYLVTDLSALIDYLRLSFPGASPTTPFIDGGLLPYWVDAVNGTEGVMSAIYALNTSRVCTATADSRIYPDYQNGLPYGDPKYRSGASGDVIHFTATQAFFLGFQYWTSYARAVALTSVVPSQQTQACPGVVIQGAVPRCG
jgi:hypothetical protein